ncbi:GntR family transcriptional regulator [Streptomyces albus subsp. albus]|nr:GntR family transcriptional regulator [Streptomyces albus subsp. albus]
MAVTDEAIERIRAMIASGVLRPGDRLPRERELAAELGLSRNSLREAVRALALIGVLDVRQGDGTYVTGLDPRRLTAALGFAADLHGAGAEPEFLAVRRLLEPAATALACGRIEERVLDQLSGRLDALGPHSSAEQLAACDLEFHGRIGQAAGNDLLGALLEALSGPADRVRLWRGLPGPEAVGRVLDEHRAILAALRDRDAEAARSWATVHLAGVQRLLRSAG